MENRDLRAEAKKFQEKLSKIKVALFDIDGVLTTGQLFYHGEIGYNRIFHCQDGYGMKVLMKAGLKVGVISGGDGRAVRHRFCELLKVDYAHFGNDDKRDAWQKVLDCGYRDEEILYVGDELFDIPLLRRAGFSATVPHASYEIQEVVDYVTSRNGGMGAGREVIDMLRYAQNIVPEIAY